MLRWWWRDPFNWPYTSHTVHHLVVVSYTVHHLVVVWELACSDHPLSHASWSLGSSRVNHAGQVNWVGVRLNMEQTGHRTKQTSMYLAWRPSTTVDHHYATRRRWDGNNNSDCQGLLITKALGRNQPGHYDSKLTTVSAIHFYLEVRFFH